MQSEIQVRENSYYSSSLFSPYLSIIRLYLHTITSPVLIPKELAAYTLTVQFHLTLTDLEEIFLTRFMMKEKRNIFIEQNTLLQVNNYRIEKKSYIIR